MNAFAQYVTDHYDEVRHLPSHERFKELARMYQESKGKKTKAKETK